MNTISTQELIAMKNHGDDFMLINTLNPQDFAATRIPESMNFPQADPDFVQRVEQVASGKDDPIVVYCAGLECNSSAQGAEKLAKAGFTNVRKYEGGARAWREAAQAGASRNRMSAQAKV